VSTLDAVLDEIVPPSRDGKLPGAGALGMASFVARAIDATPLLRAVVEPGLAALDASARQRGAADFAALARAERTDVLREVAAAHPAFAPSLASQTYLVYYRQPEVLAALGLEPRPPFPLGHTMEPDDLELLEAVRERGRRYRDA